PRVYWQRVAFGQFDCVPPAESFCEVKLQDMSAAGCSFLFHALPPAEDLLLRVGHDAPVYMRAKVKHATPRMIQDEQHYLIGCSFIGCLENNGQQIDIARY